MIEPLGDDLQFDRAVYAESEDVPGCCSACEAALTNTYYVANDTVLCGQCKELIRQAVTAGSGLVRFIRASFFGVIASAIGAGIYFAIVALTGYEIGLVAIVVGVLVGIAVRYGASGRGGWIYQGLAILLTYSSIVATYIPPIIEAMDANTRNEALATAEDDSKTVVKITIQLNDSIWVNGKPASVDDLERELAKLTPDDGVVWYHRKGVENQASSYEVEMIDYLIYTTNLPRFDFNDAQFTQPELFVEGMAKAGIIALLATYAFLFVFACFAPFLALPGNLIGLLIIGFAVYEAWKINKRAVVNITGPFSLAEGQPAISPPDNQHSG